MSPFSASITTLTRELLLQIFEDFAPHQTLDPNATSPLCCLARCCKAWYPLAQSVLYRDVVLHGQRLLKFAYAPTSTGLAQIRTLTLQLEGLSRDPFHPDGAEQAERGRLHVLYSMVRRVAAMTSLASFSMRLEILSPHDSLVSPYLHAASLLIDCLPVSCVSLEVDVLSDITYSGTTGPMHMCPSVSRALPRLEHLRLRVPWMCPALVTTTTTISGQEARETEEEGDGDGDGSKFKFVDAPKLRDFTLNLSLRDPGSHSLGHHTSSCWTPGRPNAILGLLNPMKVHVVSALHSDKTPSSRGMAPVLEGFCAHNLKRNQLERLRVIDSQHRPERPPNTWAAWIRRDFVTKTSLPIPVTSVGTSGMSCMLRLPRGQDDDDDGAAAGTTEDWVADWKTAEELAEGCTWTTTPGGVRLPRQVMRTMRGYEPYVPGTVVTGERARQQAREVTAVQLWEHEEATGRKLLPEGPGALMQRWDLREETPSGWRRPDEQHAPMVQLAD